MKINQVHFVGSFPTYQECPSTPYCEFAIIGRSNVGKSSLINMLTQRRSISKVSTTPGKTQYINLFKIDNRWCLVDLPGYGFAKLSKVKRLEFDKMIRNYLLYRTNLFNTFVLIDSHIPPQKIDLEFIQWLGENGIPFMIIFTKADKQSLSKTKNNLHLFKKKLAEDWETLPDIIETSSVNKKGREEILSIISKNITP